MVRAGDHWSLRMSRQMAPDCDEMFGCLSGGGGRGGWEGGRKEGWATSERGEYAMISRCIYVSPNKGRQAEALVVHTRFKPLALLVPPSCAPYFPPIPLLHTHQILVRNFILGGSKG